MILTGTKTALAVNRTASFLATAGVGPYTYSVVAGGAGGTINSATGLYAAPAVVPSDPAKLFDTIRAVDDESEEATATIMVGTPLLLFCEILQREMNLANGRVFIWDQKIFQPTDSNLYIAVDVSGVKAFANNKQPDPVDGWSRPIQTANFMARLGVNVISRGPAARDRKEEIILALGSVYAQQQQEGNSFLIGKLPPASQFVNLNHIDGAAIPYRFNITVNMQYAVQSQKASDYFDDFDEVEITTES